MIPTLLGMALVDGHFAGLSALFAGLGVGMMLWRFAAIRDLTLLAPWSWALASLFSLAAAEVLITTAAWGPDAATALRFVAAAGSLTPGMSQLGAKRPQHGAWNFVVVSLWLVLALPAVEFFFLDRTGPFVVRGARACFLASLIGVGLLNYLPTRFAVSAVFVAASQCVLFAHVLAPVLRGVDWAPHSARVALALGLVDVAIGLAASNVVPRRPARAGRDRLWLDFRDAFGTLWGLRVAERVNAAAAANRWNLTLGWRGFRKHNDAEPSAASAAVDRQLNQVLRNLLRRFVSTPWLESRLGAEPSVEETSWESPRPARPDSGPGGG